MVKHHTEHAKIKAHSFSPHKRRNKVTTRFFSLTCTPNISLSSSGLPSNWNTHFHLFPILLNLATLPYLLLTIETVGEWKQVVANSLASRAAFREKVQEVVWG